MAARQIEDSDGILIVPQGARLPAPAAAPAPDKSHCCLVRQHRQGFSRYLMAEATNGEPRLTGEENDGVAEHLTHRLRDRGSQCVDTRPDINPNVTSFTTGGFNESAVFNVHIIE